MSHLDNCGDTVPGKKGRKKKKKAKSTKKSESRVSKTEVKTGNNRKKSKKKKGAYPKKNKHGKASTSYLRRKARLKSSRGKTIEVTKQKKVNQTPRGKKLDEDFKALPPGWRVSKSGHLYYEDRSNRSDKPGSRL